MNSDDNPTPELSRPLAIDKIPAGGIDETLEAREGERQQLADRFGLLDLPSLKAELSVRRASAGQMFEIKGRMIADVVQQCVVTLEPLPAHIEQEIDVLYATPDFAGDESAVMQGTLDEEETEIIVNGIIDLGELVAQYLGTSLDPYPRKPGIAYVEVQYGTPDEKPNPFAELAKLKKP